MTDELIDAVRRMLVERDKTLVVRRNASSQDLCDLADAEAEVDDLLAAPPPTEAAPVAPVDEADKKCGVCGGRAKACAHLGHRPEDQRHVLWHPDDLNASPATALVAHETTNLSDNASCGSQIEHNPATAPQASEKPSGANWHKIIRAQALEAFREWLSVTGAMPEGSSWVGECEGLIADAVDACFAVSATEKASEPSDEPTKTDLEIFKRGYELGRKEALAATQAPQASAGDALERASIAVVEAWKSTPVKDDLLRDKIASLSASIAAKKDAP